MPRSTQELRALWKAYECAEDKMVTIPFGPDRIRVAPPTVDAWKALAAVLAAHGYVIRIADTDSYNCRTITGGVEKSLHSYGIALDINWQTNPYRDHSGDREVRFSTKPSQDQRAIDVKRALADTDMTQAMIEDVRAIKTKTGAQIFEWGGDWRSVKDSMHFELDLGPTELAAGVDWSTVAQAVVSPFTVIPSRYRVIARDGLRLRAGPGIEFSVRRTLERGVELQRLGQNGDWALVDLEGDGLADGHVHSSYLEPV